MAMFLGTQNHDGISKALGLHLPFFLSVASRLPHTVEYMYIVSAAMMEGAPLSIGGYFGKCLAPISLGNTLGGAVFTGGYLWLVNIYSERGKGDGNGDDGQRDDLPSSRYTD